MGIDEEFQGVEKAKAIKRLVQESEDHNNALAGNFDTGRRINRGLKDKDEHEQNVQKRAKQSLSQALRLNTRYAAQYQAVMQNLNDAEDAVYAAQVRSAERVSEAQSAVRGSLDAASTLADGTEVFQSEDGSVYTFDERLVNDDALEEILWREGSPSWETYKGQLAELEEARLYHERMNAHGDRLSELRSEMEDEDNPISENRLAEINEEIDEISNKAKPAYKSDTEFSAEYSESSTYISLDLDSLEI